MADRIGDALRWLSSEFSATAGDFRAEFKRDADDLRDGLMAHGYAIHDKRQDRYAVSDVGRRRLAEVEPAEAGAD